MHRFRLVVVSSTPILLSLLWFMLWVSPSLASSVAKEDKARAMGQLTPFEVAAGTHLIGLARDYCRDPEDWKIIARINKISPPYLIRAQGILQIPLSLLITEKLAAEAASVQGQVWVRGLNGATRPLAAGGRIQPGETVLTERDSHAHLIFPGQAHTRIEPESSLGLSYLFRLNDGKIKADMLLQRGSLVHQLHQKLRANDSFNTRTPVVITGVRGTEYRLKAKESNRHSVETLQGLVMVQSAGKTTELEAGKGVQVRKGMAPEAPRTLPAAPSASLVAPIYRSLPAVIPVPALKGVKALRLRLSMDQAGMQTVADQIAPQGAALKLSSLKDGAYFGFLSVIDHDNFESIATGPLPFTLRTNPPAPTIASPRDASTLWGKRAEVSWLAAEHADHYLAQLASDAQFTQLIDEQKLDRPSYASPDLQPGKYFFRVQTVAADGFVTDFSSPLGWTQKDAPALAGMQSTADQPPVLQWPPMGKDWVYDLQVATDKEFANLIVDQQGLKNPNYTLEQKLDPGSYYVRIRGVGDGEPLSAWTPAQEMTVKNKPMLVEGILMSTLIIAIILL